MRLDSVWSTCIVGNALRGSFKKTRIQRKTKKALTSDIDRKRIGHQTNEEATDGIVSLKPF
jgi:hypothetical protein